jgi:hypothetical protein
MADVYSRAKDVVVWLGPAGAHTDAAMEAPSGEQALRLVSMEVTHVGLMLTVSCHTTPMSL